MFQIFSNSGTKAYGVKSFIVDRLEDISTIPTQNLEMGSECFVISSSQSYMLNSDKQWVAVTKPNNNNDDSSTPQIIIYEGGIV